MDERLKNIDQRMIEMIENEVMTSCGNISWQLQLVGVSSIVS